MLALFNTLLTWTDAPKQIPSLESNSPKGPTLTQAVKIAFATPTDPRHKVNRAVTIVESRAVSVTMGGKGKGVEPLPTLTEQVRKLLQADIE